MAADPLSRLRERVHKKGTLFVRGQSFPYLWHSCTVELLKDGSVRWTKTGHSSVEGEASLCDSIDFRTSEVRHGKRKKTHGLVIKMSGGKKSVHLSSTSEAQVVQWKNAFHHVCLLLVHCEKLQELLQMDASRMSRFERLEMANELAVLEQNKAARALYISLLAEDWSDDFDYDAFHKVHQSDSHSAVVDFDSSKKKKKKTAATGFGAIGIGTDSSTLKPMLKVSPSVAVDLGSGDWDELHEAYEFFLAHNCGEAKAAEQHFLERTRFFLLPEKMATDVEVYNELMEHCMRVRFGYNATRDWDTNTTTATATPSASETAAAKVKAADDIKTDGSELPVLRTPASASASDSGQHMPEGLLHMRTPSVERAAADAFVCVDDCIIVRPDSGSLATVRRLVKDWALAHAYAHQMEYSLAKLEDICNEMFLTVTKHDKTHLSEETYKRMRRGQQVDMLTVSQTGELRTMLSGLETQAFGRLGSITRKFLDEFLTPSTSGEGASGFQPMLGPTKMQPTVSLDPICDHHFSDEELTDGENEDELDEDEMDDAIMDSATLRMMASKSTAISSALPFDLGTVKEETGTGTPKITREPTLEELKPSLPLAVQTLMNFGEIPRFTSDGLIIMDYEEELDGGAVLLVGDDSEIEEDEEEIKEEEETKEEEEEEMAAMGLDISAAILVSDASVALGSVTGSDSFEKKKKKAKTGPRDIGAISSVMANKHKRFTKKYPNVDMFSVLLLVWMVRQTETSHIVRPEEYYHFKKRVPAPLLVEAAKAKMETIRLKTAVVDIPVVRKEADKLGLTAALKVDSQDLEDLAKLAAAKPTAAEVLSLETGGGGVHATADGSGTDSGKKSNGVLLSLWRSATGGGGSQVKGKKRKGKGKRGGDESKSLSSGGGVVGGSPEFLPIAVEVATSKTMRTNLNRTNSEERHYVLRSSASAMETSLALRAKRSTSSWSGRFEQSDLLTHKHLLIKVLTVLYTYAYSCFRDTGSDLFDSGCDSVADSLRTATLSAAAAAASSGSGSDAGIGPAVVSVLGDIGDRDRILTMFALGCKDGDPYEVRYSLLTQALSMFHSQSVQTEHKHEMVKFIVDNKLLSALSLESREVMDDFFGATALRELRAVEKAYDKGFAHFKSQYKGIWKEMKCAFYIDPRHEIKSFTHDSVLGDCSSWLQFTMRSTGGFMRSSAKAQWYVDATMYATECQSRGLRPSLPPLKPDVESLKRASATALAHSGSTHSRGFGSLLHRVKVTLTGDSSASVDADSGGISRAKTLPVEVGSGGGVGVEEKMEGACETMADARKRSSYSGSLVPRSNEAEHVFVDFVIKHCELLSEAFVDCVAAKIGHLYQSIMPVPVRHIVDALEMVEMLKKKDDDYSLSEEAHFWKANGLVDSLRCYCVFETINSLWEAFEVLAGPLPSEEESEADKVEGDEDISLSDYGEDDYEYAPTKTGSSEEITSGVSASASGKRVPSKVAMRVCLVKNHISSYKPKWTQPIAGGPSMRAHYVTPGGVWIAKRKTLTKSEKKARRKGKRRVKKKKDLIKEATKRLERDMETTEAKVLRPDFSTGLRYIAVNVAIRDRRDSRRATIAEVRLVLSEHWKHHESYLQTLRLFDRVFTARSKLFDVFRSFEKEKRRDLSTAHSKWYWNEEILPMLP